MPRGTYLHVDDDLTERFQCAPGPGGWRYVSTIGPAADGGTTGTTVDIAVDSRWRQVRVQLMSPDWIVRGGSVGRDLLWVRAGRSEPGAAGSSSAAEHSATAMGFVGDSPGFLAAVARALRLDEGERADVPLVVLTGAALAGRTAPRRWELAEVSVHPTETSPLRVERYDVTDLETGEREAVHLAGDVVLAATGIELTELSGPPSGLTPR
jgi:hypothetical protein